VELQIPAELQRESFADVEDQLVGLQAISRDFEILELRREAKGRPRQQCPKSRQVR